MKNYGDVMTMMGEFLHSVEAEKALAKQAEAPTPGPNDDAKTEPEGKSSEHVADAKAGQGAAGKEKQQDMEKGIQGVEADTAEATNKDGDGEEPTDNQGPKSLDASEQVTENITVETTPEKVARADRLGNAILGRVADLRKNAYQQPQRYAPVYQAPMYQEADIIQKLASESPELADHIAQSYHDFATGWLEGFNQRQEDLSEMVGSGLFKSAEEADAMLDAVAAEDPGAIAPPGMEVPVEEPMMDEGMEGEGDLDPETAAQLDALADEMAEAGVTPEDLVEAASQLEELTAAGVSPEEIVQAAGEVQAEDEAGIPPEAVEEAEKIAGERKSIIKSYIRGLQA